MHGLASDPGRSANRCQAAIKITQTFGDNLCRQTFFRRQVRQERFRPLLRTSRHALIFVITPSRCKGDWEVLDEGVPCRNAWFRLEWTTNEMHVVADGVVLDNKSDFF